MQIIEIFGQSGCRFCEDARRLCSTKSYPFVYRDLAHGAARRLLLHKRQVPPKTVPVIFIGTVEIAGGYQGLLEADRTGVLHQLIGGE